MTGLEQLPVRVSRASGEVRRENRFLDQYPSLLLTFRMAKQRFNGESSHAGQGRFSTHGAEL